MATTGKVIALIKGLAVTQGSAITATTVSGTTMTASTALVVGTADTSGVRLDIESGNLAIREGDDSAYAPICASVINIGSTQDVGFGRLAAGIGYCNGGGASSTASFIHKYYVQNYTGDSTTSNNNVMYFGTNAGAGGAINLTLPSAAAGLHHTAFVAVAQYYRITAAAGDNIIHLGTTSATAGYVRNNVVGSWIHLVAIDATSWVTVSNYGTWTIDS